MIKSNNVFKNSLHAIAVLAMFWTPLALGQATPQLQAIPGIDASVSGVSQSAVAQPGTTQDAGGSGGASSSRPGASQWGPLRVSNTTGGPGSSALGNASRSKAPGQPAGQALPKPADKNVSGASASSMGGSGMSAETAAIERVAVHGAMGGGGGGSSSRSSSEIGGINSGFAAPGGPHGFSSGGSGGGKQRKKHGKQSAAQFGKARQRAGEVSGKGRGTKLGGSKQQHRAKTSGMKYSGQGLR